MSRSRQVDRRTARAVLAAGAVCLAGLGWWLVPWDPVPGGSLFAADVSTVLTPDEVALAEAHHRVVRPLVYSALGVSIVVALLFALTPAGAWLVRMLARRLVWWLAVPVATFLLLLVGRVATLPFALLLRQERLRVGLTTQGIGGWLSDRGLSLVLSWIGLSVLGLLVVGLARRSPRWWYLWAAGVAAIAICLVSAAYPLVVEPLFNRFEEMPEGDLKEAIVGLADREGVEVEDVLVADASRRTTTLNAYVSGIGGTRRIVVYDTLLESAPPEEVLSIVAHEIGHARYHDVLLGTGLAAVAMVPAMAALALLLASLRVRRRVAIRGPEDPACIALVLAAVSIGMLLASPTRNTVSRAIETRADRFAITSTGDPEAFVAVQSRLAVASLADPTPPPWLQRWFGTHPTVLERAGLPASMAEADG